ncbi:MAG: alpha/beta hydrolase [Planctomycetota bacterium]|nr:alpha/beta hydrolase [Planctomycetota bacterium]
MRRWLLDRLVMAPSTDAIDPESRIREVLPTSCGDVELWKDLHVNGEVSDDQSPELLMIKFPGTGGRAERATAQPAQFWLTPKTELWAVNPPGYGGAKGRASLHHIERMVEAIRDHLESKSIPKVILVANSLGNLAALKLATLYPVSGLVLRNPPDIPLVVHHRSRAYRATWLGRWLGTAFPPNLDLIATASQCSAPAVFIHSERDQLVPLELQRPISSAYCGPKKILIAQGIDHADPIPDHQVEAYRSCARWLEQQAYR